eukprot:s1641_g15.t1
MLVLQNPDRVLATIDISDAFVTVDQIEPTIVSYIDKDGNETVFALGKERLARLETEPDLMTHMRKLGWLHATENQWHYLRWSPEKEALVPEDPARMSPHAALQAHIEDIMTLLEEPQVLYQFNTITRLTPDLDQTLPFFIKVSLQGANAQNLFQRLLHLCGLGCLQMVDMTLRRERLEPQKLSKQVQQGMRKW